MINKALVKKRFEKSFKTYNDNAVIQKIMAEKLINLLPKKEFNSVFEIGCATGILTEQINKNIQFKTFNANDIIENSKNYIEKIIPSCNFIKGDIETLEIPNKYDLIISNACLQWCNNIEATINKLKKHITKEGIIAISIFGNDNLREIDEIFNINNKNYDFNILKKHLSELGAEIKEDIVQLEFNSIVEILKHIKNTGANAVKEMSLTKSKLQEYEEEYKKKYENNKKLILTYNPVYIVLRY